MLRHRLNRRTETKHLRESWSTVEVTIANCIAVVISLQEGGKRCNEMYDVIEAILTMATEMCISISIDSTSHLEDMKSTLNEIKVCYPLNLTSFVYLIMDLLLIVMIFYCFIKHYIDANKSKIRKNPRI